MKKSILLILVVLLMSVSFVQAEAMENTDVGSIVTFGSYEQGNGEAPIEWIVLDKQEDRVLILSRYALDCKPFHETEDWNVTWAECSLRSWLNEDFIDSAFSEEERARIISVTNTTADAPDTQDSVFLLSLDELNAYLPNEESRITEATEYTVEQGGRVSRTTGKTYWWLRTKAMSDDCVHMVKYDGTADEFGDSMEAAFYTVRPAVWVDIA
ncbi:MAG: DUF6273 domain-containing protein [Lachnospiraceae bacterium]|nr:DUF6273 domain-containing protein [Lachnospiraceae bacterium]